MQVARSNGLFPSLDLFRVVFRYICVDPQSIKARRCKHSFQMHECLAVDDVQGIRKRCIYETERSKKCLIMRHERRMCMKKQEGL